jgi:hypothetical protein
MAMLVRADEMFDLLGNGASPVGCQDSLFLEAGDPGTSQARADGLGAEPRGGHTTMTCAEGHMRFEGFSFGSIRIDGVSYDHDIVIDRGEVSKRRKKPSKRFRDDFGHTPLSTEEKIPWKCRRLIVGTGTGALPVMEEVKVEAKRRKVELLIVPTAQAIGILREKPAETNAILHVTC